MGERGPPDRSCQKSLALQLWFSFDMRFLSGSLMGGAPKRPGDNVSGFVASLREAKGYAPDFLDRPVNEVRRLVVAGCWFFWIPACLLEAGSLGDGSRPSWRREHDKRDMAMPAMPRTGFAVVEAELGPGGLEAVLDRPHWQASTLGSVWIVVPTRHQALK